MQANEISEELQDGLYKVEEDFCIIKHLSNALLKCIEDNYLTKLEVQSLITALNDRIWAYNENLQKFIKSSSPPRSASLNREP